MKTKTLVAILLAMLTIRSEAQNKKPYKMEQFTWQQNAWQPQSTYNYRYDNNGSITWVKETDALNNVPVGIDTSVYNAQNRVITHYKLKWNAIQNEFQFQEKIENCFDSQQRDCGSESFNYISGNWEKSTGYLRTYTYDDNNKKSTEVLSNYDKVSNTYKEQFKCEKYFNNTDEKIATVIYVVNPQNSILEPYQKEEYNGWHNEEENICKNIVYYNYNNLNNQWVLSHNTVTEDSIDYWKFIQKDLNNSLLSYTNSWKDGSAIKTYELLNNSMKLTYHYIKNGLIETEKWFTYNANGIKISEHEEVTEKDTQGNLIRNTSRFWDAPNGWKKDEEYIYDYTYNNDNTIAQIVAKVYDSSTQIIINDYKQVFSDYREINRPNTGPCQFTPTVEGDTIFCPESFTTLYTQSYDSYQWYTRPYNSSNAPQPVNGETDSTFTIDAYSTILHVSVEATKDGCTERSAEVLVDIYAFTPLIVFSSGNFIVDTIGRQFICEGDSIVMNINSIPYDTDIQWYDRGIAISNANDDTLVVKRPGEYTVSAAPFLCPDYTRYLGSDITVMFLDPSECGTTGISNPSNVGIKVFPNPVSNELKVEMIEPATATLSIVDLQGKIHWQSNFTGKTIVPVNTLAKGFYMVNIKTTHGIITRKIQVK